MTVFLCYILGTSYLCHVVAHANISERLRQRLEVVALIGTALAAVGYYAEAFHISFGYQIWSMIEVYLANLGADLGPEYLGACL